MHPFHHAKTMPDAPAIVMARPGGEVVTYAELEDRSNQGAQLFRKLGLKRGDAIAFMLDNSPRVHEIYFAAQRSGLLFTAMSTRLSLSEAEYILADCGAKVFLVSASLEPLAAELVSRTPARDQTLLGRWLVARARELGTCARRHAGRPASPTRAEAKPCSIRRARRAAPRASRPS